MKKIIAGLMAISMLIVPMQSAFAEENNKLDSVSSTEKVESIKTEFEQMFEFDNSIQFLLVE